MPVDFSNVDKFKVKLEKTRRYELSRMNLDGNGCVVLIGTYAGVSNRSWMSAVVKNAPSLKVFSEDQGMEETEYNSKRENELIADHSITGWEHVVDAAGEVVPFDPKVFLEFMDWLDKEDATRVRMFFQNRLNFMDGADESEAAALGNS